MGLLFQDESYAIIGAAQEVHAILGNGFLEAVYQEALGLEFRQRGIPYKKEKELRTEYKGQVLAKKYQADFVCYENLTVELKAGEILSSGHGGGGSPVAELFERHRLTSGPAVQLWRSIPEV